MLPGKMVLSEHYRLGSGCVILSRSFCNVDKVQDFSKIQTIFHQGVAEIRMYEKHCETVKDFSENQRNVQSAVERIVSSL